MGVVAKIEELGWRVVHSLEHVFAEKRVDGSLVVQAAGSPEALFEAVKGWEAHRASFKVDPYPAAVVVQGVPSPGPVEPDVVVPVVPSLPAVPVVSADAVRRAVEAAEKSSGPAVSTPDPEVA